MIQTRDNIPLYNQPLSEKELEILIESLIGGLNGRWPFMKYLKRESQKIIKVGGSRDDVVSMIKAEHHFWSYLLRVQMDKYDKMRIEDSGVRREYAFTHYEFDDLFRFFDDPKIYFNIDINKSLSAEEVQLFVEKFGSAIKDKRPIPWSILPISLPRFFFSIYKNIFLTLINLSSKIIIGRSLMPNNTDKIFTPSKSIDRDKKGIRIYAFWKLTLGLSFLFNFTVLLFIYFTFISGNLPLEIALFLFILAFILIPISLRTIIQIGRVCVSFFYGKRIRIAKIRTWKQVVGHFKEVWDRAGFQLQWNYNLMIEELYSNFIVNGSEYNRLSNKDLEICPYSNRAQERIKRWMNKYYLKESTDSSYDFTWDEIKPLTILVFSSDEKFYYPVEELIENEALYQLRKSYFVEWDNLVKKLEAILSEEERRSLCVLQKDFPILENKKAIESIEQWANLRLQTLYNTLEGVRKLYKVYRYIVQKEYPNKDLNQIESLVKEKIQIIFLHDYYPIYETNNKQKIYIDKYLNENPEIELQWPKNLLHTSKYGSFANVLPHIRGEFLLTLDSDHSINIEEIAFLPCLLKKFNQFPECDVIGYRLSAFNIDYNLITNLAGLTNNSWWIQDLRVKALLGGGGIYGKFIIRVSSLKEKEFIQPDSVGEDMLALARLITYNSKIIFCEEMEFGQGEDITFYGLKRKYGRYPIGAIESSSSKIFKEMLLSPITPVYRKLEALFMLSYYPNQILIAFSHFMIFLAWALNIKLFSYIPIFTLFTTYLLIALSDSFYVWVGLYEKEGFRKATKKYYSTLFLMTLFHGAYFYHYLEQTIKALKGYARFNISEKDYVLTKHTWFQNYIRNKFSFNFGCVILTMFILGIILHDHSPRELIVAVPFFITGLIWGFGVLVFVPRNKELMVGFDIIGEIIFIIINSYKDILLRLFSFLKKTKTPRNG